MGAWARAAVAILANAMVQRTLFMVVMLIPSPAGCCFAMQLYRPRFEKEVVVDGVAQFRLRSRIWME